MSHALTVIALSYGNQGLLALPVSRAQRPPHRRTGLAAREVVEFSTLSLPDETDVFVLQPMTGHKTRSVFERYNIVSGGDLRDAARKLDGAEVRAKRSRA